MEHVLPEGWKWVKLGDVCKTTSGGTPSRRELKYYSGNIPWVKSGELDKGLITDTEEKISEEAVKNSSAKIFPKGTLLIALYGATIGKLAFLGVDAATNQAICGIYRNDEIESKFLFNYLLLKKQKLVDQGIGGAQPNISQTILKNLELPLPPKTVQQVIVSKIEELFSEIDKGIETLRTAQQQLKVYRQAVLKWAFEGKLTNVDVKDGELPEGWKWVKIEDATISLDNKRKPINKAERLLRPGDVPYYGANGQVGWIDDFLFDEPLVCIVEDETFTGRTIPFSYKIEGKAWVNNHAHVLKAKDNLNIDFLNYQLSYYPFLRLTTGTTGRKKLTKNALMNAPIKICSVTEQERVVAILESRLSIADKMEETITQSLQQAEVLKQSILKQAFEGKLTSPAIAVAKKSIPLPPPVIEDPYARKVFAAYIISKCSNGRHFGKVVFQKTLHLAEYHCQCDYETMYLQKAAGPLDEFINRFIGEAAEKSWFTTHLKNKQIRFEPGFNLPELLLKYPQMFVAENAGMQQVLQLINNETLDAAELYSTVYAVWNNSLIRGVKPTQKSIVSDVYDWSDRKEKFSPEQILDAKNVLERTGLMPLGFGKEILKEGRL